MMLFTFFGVTFASLLLRGSKCCLYYYKTQDSEECPPLRHTLMRFYHQMHNSTLHVGTRYLSSKAWEMSVWAMYLSDNLSAFVILVCSRWLNFSSLHCVLRQRPSAWFKETSGLIIAMVKDPSRLNNMPQLFLTDWWTDDCLITTWIIECV